MAWLGLFLYRLLFIGNTGSLPADSSEVVPIAEGGSQLTELPHLKSVASGIQYKDLYEAV